MGTVLKQVTVTVTGSIARPKLFLEGAEYPLSLNQSGSSNNVVWVMGPRDIIVEDALDVICIQYGWNGGSMTVSVDYNGTTTKRTATYKNGIAVVRKSI